MEIFLLAFTAGIACSMAVLGIRIQAAYTLFVAAAIGVVISLWYLWAAYGADMVVDYWVTKDTSAASKLTQLGQAGDLFGGINALFAAFAFAGVLFAAVVQTRTLHVTAKQQSQQAFEPLFFHLLELHREVFASTLTPPPLSTRNSASLAPQKSGGPIKFGRAVMRMRRQISILATNVPRDTSGNEELARRVGRFYESVYRTNQDELGPHFRSLYHIFKLIDQSQFPEDVRVKYANIARATLGKDQLFLLAVNCTSPFGAEFKPLIERYGLLKHIDRRVSFETIDHRIARQCYEPTAIMDAKERAALWATTRGQWRA